MSQSGGGRARRNVLHVLSDQHLATCIGAAGHPQAITPNMDRLAREGVMFASAYAQNTICTPNRMSLLSGQYCHNHGYYGLSGPTPAALPSFLGHFHANGYRTGAIGKLHLPDHETDWLDGHVDLHLEAYPRGSAGYRGRPGTNPYVEYLDEVGMRDLEDTLSLPEFPGVQQIDARPSLLPYEHSVEGWCVQRAIAFMDAAAEDDTPFCIQVSLPRPHQCFTPDRRFWEMYPDDLDLPATFGRDVSHRPPNFQRLVAYWQKQEGFIEPKGYEHLARRVWRGYLACITHVDHALGELLSYLDDTGQAGNTVVVYGSDHGAYSSTYGLLEKAPGISSEAVCRVPSIWRVPDVAPGGQVCTEFIEHVDLAPTLASLCDLPAMQTVDGYDITALLEGGGTPVREVAVTENAWSKAIRYGQWRFVHYQRELYGGSNVGELYDLSVDPDEQRNLYHDPNYGDVVAECRRLVLEWLIRTTRVVTLRPVNGYTQWPPDFQTAEDGKQSTDYGRFDVSDRPGIANFL